jgi:PKD domain-containing protein
MVASLMDEYANPWNADWYRSKVKEALGARLDDSYRLWYTDHALHGGPAQPKDNLRVINYTGILQQALRDLSAWVEKGMPPPPSTTYKVADGQIVVPSTAAERQGIQPVVTLTANGSVRAEVALGQPVTFSAIVEAPPNTGKIVAAEWDFEGTGDYPVAGQLSDTSSSRVSVKTTHSFSKPGTYFPALRVTSQRQGNAQGLYGRLRNLDRVRVVVK